VSSVDRAAQVRGTGRAEQADLLVLVLDGSLPLNPVAATTGTARAPGLVVLAKADLGIAVTPGEVAHFFPGKPTVSLSAHAGEGVERFLSSVARLLSEGGVVPAAGEGYLNARQRRSLAQARECADRAKDLLLQSGSEDLAAVEIRESLSLLDALSGADVGEAVLDRIFSEFCIGK
jgi:tRNA modification GTPase